MKTIARIALSMPDRDGKYFSLSIKNDLYNEPAEYKKPDRLLVISDIEGNFRTFLRLLVKSKVIDNKGHWIFEKGHLVIVGNCFDIGEQLTESLWLIYSLEERARREGGYVHFILGNHEIMNLNGDWRYVHPKYAKKKETSKTPSTALYTGNSELWRWLRTKNIIEKIGDILFVHGGISRELLTLNLSVTDINIQVRPYYTQANELFNDPLLNTVFNSENSPFTYKGYYQPGINEELVDATLSHFGVKTIITGHSITDTIGSYFSGKIININTDHAAGKSEALLIKKDRFYKLNSEGKRERIHYLL